jgi:hypothetical protein
VKGCLCRTVKPLASGGDLREQLRNGHFHNEAAESSQDFLNVPALLTKNQLLGKLPRVFLREQPVEDRQISVGFPQSSDRLPLKHDRWVVFPMFITCQRIGTVGLGRNSVSSRSRGARASAQNNDLHPESPTPG